MLASDTGDHGFERSWCNVDQTTICFNRVPAHAPISRTFGVRKKNQLQNSQMQRKENQKRITYLLVEVFQHQLNNQDF